MSVLARSKSQQKIFIDANNYDVFDTLNGPFIASLPSDSVPDTPENRANAALAVCYQLAVQVRQLRREVNELKVNQQRH